jgi:hypothetical protein
MAIENRELLKQTILDEMGGSLHACFESALDYFIRAEKRQDELEAENRALKAENTMLRRGFTYGGARAKPGKRPGYMVLDTGPALDVDQTASPNG